MSGSSTLQLAHCIVVLQHRDDGWINHCKSESKDVKDRRIHLLSCKKWGLLMIPKPFSFEGPFSSIDVWQLNYQSSGIQVYNGNIWMLPFSTMGNCQHSISSTWALAHTQQTRKIKVEPHVRGLTPNSRQLHLGYLILRGIAPQTICCPSFSKITTKHNNFTMLKHPP